MNALGLPTAWIRAPIFFALAAQGPGVERSNAFGTEAGINQPTALSSHQPPSLSARGAGGRRNAPGPATGEIRGGIALACVGLAFSGVYELWAGHAGVGILGASLVEAALALGFLTARA